MFSRSLSCIRDACHHPIYGENRWVRQITCKLSGLTTTTVIAIISSIYFLKVGGYTPHDEHGEVQTDNSYHTSSSESREVPCVSAVVAESMQENAHAKLKQAKTEASIEPTSHKILLFRVDNVSHTSINNIYISRLCYLSLHPSSTACNLCEELESRQNAVMYKSGFGFMGRQH